MFGKNLKKSNIMGTAKGIIYNKYVLYVVFLAALIDLLYSAVKEDYTYCILFVLVGFLVAFFNKNMTVILTLTIATSTILRNLIRGTGVNVEGFEEEQDKKSAKKDASESMVVKPETTTPAATMDKLKNDAFELQDAQKQIINGFEKIEPYMDKAEALIESIQETAESIQAMRKEGMVKRD
jgi:hypothetical protein